MDLSPPGPRPEVRHAGAAVSAARPRVAHQAVRVGQAVLEASRERWPLPQPHPRAEGGYKRGDVRKRVNAVPLRLHLGELRAVGRPPARRQPRYPHIPRGLAVLPGRLCCLLVGDKTRF